LLRSPILPQNYWTGNPVTLKVAEPLQEACAKALHDLMVISSPPL
jgi:hypothetical protein